MLGLSTNGVAKFNINQSDEDIVGEHNDVFVIVIIGDMVRVARKGIRLYHI